MSKKQAIAEDKFIQSLPQPFKSIMVILKYNFKEILILIVVILVGYILAFNIWLIDGHLEYKPQKIKDVTGMAK